MLVDEVLDVALVGRRQGLADPDDQAAEEGEGERLEASQQCRRQG
jgi:hypothetical protein